MKRILLTMLAMTAVAASYSQNQNRLNVAIFIHEGVQLLDFSGPAEVFSDGYAGGHPFNVYTVAPSESEIVSQRFLKIKPQYSIKNCPPPDIVLLPGGDTDKPLADKAVIEWIRTTGKSAKYMISVCTGALLLGEAGLLNGKQATTHYCCQDRLANDYPEVDVIKGVRFIDNGNIITTEGISAGIDGALYLISKIYDKETSEKIAKYMMYDWSPERYKSIIAGQD